MNDVYMLIIFSYAIMILIIGSFSYYAVQYFEDFFHVSSKVCELEIGISMMMTAIIGCLVGGRALDFMKNIKGPSNKHKILSGVKIALLCIVIITPLLMGFAFIVEATQGLIVLSIINVLVFINIGAFNCVVL